MCVHWNAALLLPPFSANSKTLLGHHEDLLKCLWKCYDHWLSKHYKMYLKEISLKITCKTSDHLHYPQGLKQPKRVQWLQRYFCLLVMSFPWHTFRWDGATQWFLQKSPKYYQNHSALVDCTRNLNIQASSFHKCVIFTILSLSGNCLVLNGSCAIWSFSVS